MLASTCSQYHLFATRTPNSGTRTVLYSSSRSPNKCSRLLIGTRRSKKRAVLGGHPSAEFSEGYFVPAQRSTSTISFENVLRGLRTAAIFNSIIFRATNAASPADMEAHDGIPHFSKQM